MICKYEIRSACEFSAEALWPLLAMAAHEQSHITARKCPFLRAYLRDWPRPGDFGFVAVHAGRVEGAAWARQFSSGEAPAFFAGASTPELVIAVSPEARGHGLGSLLLRRLIAQARGQKCSDLCLTVRQSNQAQELYKRMGFVPVAQGPNRVGTISIAMVKTFR